MKHVRLGRTGLLVSNLCLGTMTFGLQCDEAVSFSILDRATEGGITYEKTWLQSIGVDPATVTLADGCGMSQYDRITPRDLVAILQHDWNGPHRDLVLDSPISAIGLPSDVGTRARVKSRKSARAARATPT